MSFPRKLTEYEISILNSILPENKSGYLNYRKKIENYFVVREGRWGINNFYLSDKNEYLNYLPSSASVFSYGRITQNENIIDVVIHEEEENIIEVDIDYKNSKSQIDFSTAKVDSLAFWSPEINIKRDETRIINIIQNEYILVIFIKLKKIIFHEYISGINYTIPVTNFFNEIHRLKRVKDLSIRKPDIIFTSNELFGDDDFYSAFLNYNNYMRRFNLNLAKFGTVIPKKKSLFQKIFNKAKN